MEASPTEAPKSQVTPRALARVNSGDVGLKRLCLRETSVTMACAADTSDIELWGD